MNCEEVRNALGTYLEGGENEEASARIRAHLEACNECRERQRQLELLAAQLRAVPGRLDMVQQLAPALATAPAPRRFSKRLIAAVAVLASWALLVTAALMAPPIARLVPFLPANDVVRREDRANRANATLHAENARLRTQLMRSRAFALSPDVIGEVSRLIDRAGDSGIIANRDLLGQALSDSADRDVRRVELKSVLGFQSEQSAVVRVRVAVYFAGRGSAQIVDLDVSLSQNPQGVWQVTGLRKSR